MVIVDLAVFVALLTRRIPACPYDRNSAAVHNRLPFSVKQSVKAAYFRAIDSNSFKEFLMPSR